VIGVCAYPFARVFVQPYDQVQGIGNVIIAFILGLVPFCVLFVLQRTFYALGDTRTPFFFTLFQVTILIIGVLGCAFLPDQWIAVGIALVITISGALQAALAALLLRRRLGGIDGRRITRSLVKYLAAAVLPVILGLTLLFLLGGTTEDGFAVLNRMTAIMTMLIIGTVMAASYLGMLLLMRSAELSAFLTPLRARLRR